MPSDRAYSRFSMSIPAWVLKAGGRLNVPLYRASRGRLFGRIGRAPVRMNEQYAGFDDYHARTSRDIMLFVLEPR